MLKKLLPILFLFTGFQANAALITHNGYTLDEDTDIVTGGGLEWLQWDVTKGLSVNTAVAANGIFGGADYGNGWTLATNEQMAALFNAFSFNSTTTGTSLDFTANTDNTAMDNFIELMGSTSVRQSLPYGSGVNGYRESRAAYGTVSTNDVNKCSKVVSDYQQFSRDGVFVADFANFAGVDVFNCKDAYAVSLLGGGVALVRQIDVPEPSTVAILAMGLLGLGLRRKLRA
jgi:hypothetical protein